MRKSNSTTTPLSYISLFSAAGIGCYGFKMESFECIATVELLEKRINIQRHNTKCRFESGYIVGDISEEETKELIRNEMRRWQSFRGIKELDVLIATPPCQGISVANHKKGDELVRNSLVVESIKLILELRPKFIILENVRGFLNSICTDIDGKDKKIHEVINLNLAGIYNISAQIINFKDFGSNSSRTRALVLGVRKDLQGITPWDLMPTSQEPRTLRETIGKLRSLKDMGEVDDKDIFHSFRPYAARMRPWVTHTPEGHSAFDNKNPAHRPHQIVDGIVVPNKNKNGDKYSRCSWDQIGPCIHTRNDILASQSTIHPSDDRVFSIRELMILMSIPDSFKWTSTPEAELNKLPLDKKRQFLKKEEFNIRQCIGEAVPTTIFNQIAKKIKLSTYQPALNSREARSLVTQHGLTSPNNLKAFIVKYLGQYSYSELSKIIELANGMKQKHAAFYTRQDICFTLVNDLPEASEFSTLKILEPAVGAGNFIPLLIEKYKSVPEVQIDLLDIDPNAMEVLRLLLKKLDIPENFNLNFIIQDYLLLGEGGLFDGELHHYDIVIGNPPFGKVSHNPALLMKYKKGKVNQKTSNLASFFLEKAMLHSNIVAFVLPKSFLSTPEFNQTRELAAQFAISKICDYGESAFDGVKIETISIILHTKKSNQNNQIKVESYIKNRVAFLEQSYLFSNEYPYWLIYRNPEFDKTASKLRLGVFSVFRDRQITKKITKPTGTIRVLKSRNIGSNSIIDIPGYDTYIDPPMDLSVAKHLHKNKVVVLVPNLTYAPRACFAPKDALVDGSVAVLTPRENILINETDLEYFKTPEFTNFYLTARNLGSRSLNIDSNSVFFFGIQKRTSYLPKELRQPFTNFRESRAVIQVQA